GRRYSTGGEGVGCTGDRRPLAPRAHSFKRRADERARELAHLAANARRPALQRRGGGSYLRVRRRSSRKRRRAALRLSCSRLRAAAWAAFLRAFSDLYSAAMSSAAAILAARIRFFLSVSARRRSILPWRSAPTRA